MRHSGSEESVAGRTVVEMKRVAVDSDGVVPMGCAGEAGWRHLRLRPVETL